MTVLRRLARSLPVILLVLGFAAPSLHAANDPATKLELRYKPRALQNIRVTEVEKEEVSDISSAVGSTGPTVPVTRTTVYHYEKVYERTAQPRQKGGLTISLTVASAHLEVNNSPVTKDLGGMQDHDWIDTRGTPGRLGSVEDPLRPEMSLPENPVGPGDVWNQEGPAIPALPLPVHWVGHVVDRHVLPDGRVVLILEITAHRQGPVSESKMLLEWREVVRATFEPATGAVLKMETKSRRKEIYPLSGPPQRVVVVNIERESRVMKKPLPR